MEAGVLFICQATDQSMLSAQILFFFFFEFISLGRGDHDAIVQVLHLRLPKQGRVLHGATGPSA